MAAQVGMSWSFGTSADQFSPTGMRQASRPEMEGGWVERGMPILAAAWKGVISLY